MLFLLGHQHFERFLLLKRAASLLCSFALDFLFVLVQLHFVLALVLRVLLVNLAVLLLEQFLPLFLPLLFLPLSEVFGRANYLPIVLGPLEEELLHHFQVSVQDF